MYAVAPPVIVMISAPLTVAASLEPTAQHLRRLGCSVILPDVLSSTRNLPRWRDWPDILLAEFPSSRAVTLIGHSSATLLVAQLASSMPEANLILLDGDIPPAAGAVTPISSRLAEIVARLPDEAGVLPPWSTWWSEPLDRHIGIDQLSQGDRQALAMAEPRFLRTWFSDHLDLAEWMDRPTAYIQTSIFYDEALQEAQSHGWPTIRIEGTHLHPMLRPVETAEAIATILSIQQEGG